jgi:hypothetical protein
MPKLTISKNCRKITYTDEYSIFCSLDYHMSYIIYHFLKKFKSNALKSIPHDLTKSQWSKIIDKMIWAHKFIVFEGDLDEKLAKELGLAKDPFTPEEYKKNSKKVATGLKLFNKYYRDLWM